MNRDTKINVVLAEVILGLLLLLYDTPPPRCRLMRPAEVVVQRKASDPQFTLIVRRDGSAHYRVNGGGGGLCPAETLEQVQRELAAEQRAWRVGEDR
jgi:hypothetical protein